MRVSSAIYLGIAILITAFAVISSFIHGKDVEDTVVMETQCDTMYVEKHITITDTLYIEKESPIRIVYEKAAPVAYNSVENKIEERETTFYSNEEIELEDIPLVQN